MGSGEVAHIEIAGIIAIALTVISFIAIWIKVGSKVGRHDKTIETLEKKTGENSDEISKLKSETRILQVDIARHMGTVETKLDYIEKAIDAFKGGRRAKEE